jgi:hypothetical protein
LHESLETKLIDNAKYSTSVGVAAESVTTFTLTPEFFRNPAKQVVPDLRSDFAKWLEEYGLSEVRARHLSERIDSYFAVAIHNEWRSDAKFYDPIVNALESPFSESAEHELAWQRYIAHIAQMVDEPVFGESFSLRQIYIPPSWSFSNQNEGYP